MFAIAFDLVVADAAEHHPRGVTAAYTDIGVTLKRFSFERIQGSVYVCENNDMGQSLCRVASPESTALVCRSSARHPRLPD